MVDAQCPGPSAAGNRTRPRHPCRPACSHERPRSARRRRHISSLIAKIQNSTSRRRPAGVPVSRQRHWCRMCYRGLWGPLGASGGLRGPLGPGLCAVVLVECDGASQGARVRQAGQAGVEETASEPPPPPPTHTTLKAKHFWPPGCGGRGSGSGLQAPLAAHLFWPRHKRLCLTHSPPSPAAWLSRSWRDSFGT